MASRDEPLRVVFVGAGAVNFGGSAGGPWDHATRLEKIGHVVCMAIIDPDDERAHNVLRTRQLGEHKIMYGSCRLYPTLPAFLTHFSRDDCDVIFMGTQPFTRGSHKDGRDLELEAMRAGINCLLEKPLSVHPVTVEFMKYCQDVLDARNKAGCALCVGYMLRYHAAVQKMRSIISEHGGHVMALSARYHLAYPGNTNASWWDAGQSGGPIVEQATHFCDLARYLAGEVDLSSVQAQSVEASDPEGAGHLSRIPPDCDEGIPESRRVPRVTMATWRFQNGGLGNLQHVIALHGNKTERILEVFMDGLHMSLLGVQTPECRLVVRKGDSDDHVTYQYGRDDPYDTELRTFLRACRTRDFSHIRNSYEDAILTHKFTMAIKEACQSSR